MITVTNLSFSYPDKELYRDISFTLEDGKHCALIGSSGTGKSTLIQFLMNPAETSHLYDGKIEFDETTSFGYVSQFSSLDASSQLTVYDFLAEEFVKMEVKMTELCSQMETADDLTDIFEEYQNLLDRFDSVDGNNYESNIKKKLGLAGLERHESTLVTKLSGGEFKLIQIIKEMLLFPTVLIMDEPDVFLDFSRLNALKDLINSHKGTLLVITHSRYLLNHCFDKIIHIENCEVQEFDGRYIDYNFYLLQKKIELMELAAKDTAEIERNEQIVNGLRREATIYTCASRGRALNARVSLLKRLEARRIKEPFVEIKQPNIHLTTDQNLEADSIMLSVNEYKASFSETILEHVSFELKANEKVALIGPNGTGKTTLLRDIYRNESPSIQLAEGAKVEFLSQVPDEMLPEDSSVQDVFFDAGFRNYDEIISHLASYGFDSDILTQKIGKLSGGEKNLLQLAKLAHSNANLLLLDEPTSHLDTYSQLSLEKAISEYNGALFMVSHDFYTIVNCVDSILMIEDKTIRKISARKFRKMIYADHFDKDYLQLEDQKKAIETKIALALKDKNFELAGELSESLESIIEKM